MIASAGLRSFARLPPIEICPRASFRAPNSERNSSGCPWPARPPMPRISPRLRSKETPRRTFPSNPSALNATSLSASGSGGRSGYMRSIVRPVMSVTASCSESRCSVATCMPFRSTVIRSAREPTSPQRCEVKSTQAPSSRRRRTSPNSHSTSRSASAEVGSSRRRMRGSRMKADVISTIWRCARGSEPARERGLMPFTPKRSRTSAAR